MTERPIIFSGSGVLAILAGSKTQTRRVVKPQPIAPRDDPGFSPVELVWRWDHANVRRCPYGVARDRLWVRESYYYNGEGEDRSQNVAYRADGERPPGVIARWSPPIVMPRWAWLGAMALVVAAWFFGGKKGTR